MKQITRLETKEEDWNNSEAKKRYDAVLKSKTDYEIYRAKFDSPKEVAKRNAEAEKYELRREASRKRNAMEDEIRKHNHEDNVIIRNKQYYFMIENQIRKEFPIYEVRSILPIAEEVLRTSGISFDELEDYPIEGYYYKSEKLKRYFKIVRNIQENLNLRGRIKQEEGCFKILKNITDLELFGKVRSDKDDGAILPRRYDILALSARDERAFQIYSSNPGWTIPKLVDNLKNHFTNTPNLVELAYLTGELEPLVCGAETNALFRDLVRTKGMAPPPKKWEVDKDVERLGGAMVDEYNKRFKLSIVKPTQENYKTLSMGPERPRVAIIGQIIQTGDNYFWRSDLKGSVTDIYTKDFITTETEKKRLKLNENN